MKADKQGLRRLTTDSPQGNLDGILNYAYVDDKQVCFDYADGTAGIHMTEYLANLAYAKGCAVTAEGILNGACAECDCEVAVLNALGIQAAELRARLMMLEDILGDEYDLQKLKGILEEHREGRWVDVKEKLPPDSKSVLVASHEGPVYKAYYDHVHNCWRCTRTMRITHWRKMVKGPDRGRC